jgi:hypothetical protein
MGPAAASGSGSCCGVASGSAAGSASVGAMMTAAGGSGERRIVAGMTAAAAASVRACAGLGLPWLPTKGELTGTGGGEPAVVASLCIEAWRPAAELPLASLLPLLRRRLPLNSEPSDSAGDVNGRSSAASCT